MKNTLYIVSALMLMFVSCELEEDIYTFYTPENFYQSAEDAEICVNGCYAAIIGTGYGTWAYWLEEALGVDNDVVISRSNNRDGAFQLGTWSASYQNFSNCWSTFYTTIHRCNSVIENVPNVSEIDESLRNRLLAEVHFLRGVVYFEMVRIWGGVPLRENTVVSTGDDGHLARASVEDVYNLIILDFEFANKYLYNTTEMPKGRANKEAAQGYLARVHLTLGGVSKYSQYPENENMYNDYSFVDIQDSYTKAKAWADSVISGGQVTLYGDFGELFDLEHQYESEMIFSLGRMNLADYGSPMATTYAITNDYSGANWAGKRTLRYPLYQDYYESEYEFNNFDDRDLKGLHHVYTENNMAKIKYWPKDPIEDSEGNVIVNWRDSALVQYVGSSPAGWKPGGNNAWKNGGWIKKYMDGSSPTKNQHANNIPLLRYSDVLLMWAEAENELNGPDNAFAKVDMVRARVGLSGMRDEMERKNESIDKESFVTYLLRERAKEFIGEFNRKHDLVRMGKYLEYMNAIEANAAADYARPRSAYQILYPLPTSVIDNNKSIDINNYGY